MKKLFTLITVILLGAALHAQSLTELGLKAPKSENSIETIEAFGWKYDVMSTKMTKEQFMPLIETLVVDHDTAIRYNMFSMRTYIDDKIVQEIYGSYFDQMGVESSVILDGKEAVELGWNFFMASCDTKLYIVAKVNNKTVIVITEEHL